MSGVIRRSLMTITVVVIASAFSLWPSTAYAHAELVDSSPSAGETLVQAPEQVRLSFSDVVQQLGGSVTVTGADGQRYDSPETLRTSAAEVVVELRGLAASGPYTVIYRVVSSDGHVAQGTYDFQLNLRQAADSSPGDTAGATQLTAPTGPAPTTAQDNAVARTTILVLVLGALGLAFVAAMIAFLVKPREPISRRWKVTLGTVGAGLMVLGVAGAAVLRPETTVPVNLALPFGTADAAGSYLAPLQTDPMASVTLAGTQESRRSDAESKSPAGVPLNAELIRVLEVDDDPQPVLRAANALAGESGWTLTSHTKDDYHYERTIGTVPATLVVSFAYVTDPKVHPHVVGNSITLSLSAGVLAKPHTHRNQ